MSGWKQIKPGTYARSPEGEAHRKMLRSKEWQRYSVQYRKDNPTCAICGGPAELVDHIEPARGDPKKFKDPKNHRSLCRKCHNGKQAVDRGHAKWIKGCNADGTPLDPSHPWNQE